MRQTKAEMLVAIAKDALKQSKKFPVEGGGFLCKNLPEKAEEYTTEEIVKILTTEPCTVCALGACLISTVKLYNTFEFTIDRTFAEDHCVTEEGPRVAERLKKIFTPRQIWMIEAAFEKGWGYFSSGNRLVDSPKESDYYLADVARVFGSEYSNPNDRFQAIMRNIIRNKGTFVPIPRSYGKVEKEKIKKLCGV